MKWTDEKIKESILELAKTLNVNRMPTNKEMRENNRSGLSRAITLNGGIKRWSELTGLPMKKRTSKWNNDLIKCEIRKCMDILCIQRMPTSSELMGIGRGDLQNAISKNGGFRHWSRKLGLSLMVNETTKGQKYEQIVENLLIAKGYEVKNMSTGHPYDLLVNDNVKIDVKMGVAHYHFGSRAHTFRPSSQYSTCDIYICLALDENHEIENVFIIPSKFAKVKTLNVGVVSKYDKFIDKWGYIEEYSNFYSSVEA